MVEQESPKLRVGGSIPPPRAGLGCRGHIPEKDWHWKEMEEFFSMEQGSPQWMAVFDTSPVVWLCDQTNIRRYYSIVTRTESQEPA